MTGWLSPQFHVVFDPWFETVHENGASAPPTWDVMLSQHNHEVEVETDDDDPVGAAEQSKSHDHQWIAVGVQSTANCFHE